MEERVKKRIEKKKEVGGITIILMLHELFMWDLVLCYNISKSRMFTIITFLDFKDLVDN